MSEHLPEKAKHGGRRQGSGRKQKWSFSDILKIGQACEKMHQAAKDLAFNKRLDELTKDQSELRTVWGYAASIPVSERKAWRASEAGEMHVDDVKNELISLNDERSGEETTNTIFSVSTKPPPGTVKRIKKAVALEFSIQIGQVDNIWQEYKRIIKSIKI